jgi:serine phosphatase RsbU (regulator of sigma subunit)
VRGFQPLPRNRWLAWGLGIALTGLGAIAVYTFFAYQRAASALVVEKDRQVVLLSASRLKEELNTFADLLQSVGRLHDISQGDPTARRSALTSSRNRLSVFDGGVVLLDNFGKVVAAQPERAGIVGQDWSNRDFFGALLTSPEAYFSNAADDGPFGVKVIVVSVPVLGDDGELVGALAGMFRLGEPSVSSFYASILRLRLGQAGDTYIVDGNGRLLFDSAQSQSQTVIGSAVDIQQLSGISIGGAGDAIRTADDEGRDVVAAFAPIPGTQWTLVTEDDWSVLTSSTRRYGWLLIGLLGLGMALPALGVVLLSREQSSDRNRRQEIDQETRIATLIQSALLPRQIPIIPGWGISVHYRPTASVGGDFYDLLLLADGRLVVALANVPQRGVRAAVAMATTRAAIRSAARRMLCATDALVSMNEILCAELDAEDSIRCVYSILDPTSGHLTLALAGHTPPFCSNLGADQMNVQGTPLGVSLEPKFEQIEVDIVPGGCIAFFGEGVVTATNPHGEMLGRDQLHAAMQALKSDGHRTAYDLVDRLADYLGPGRDQLEDLTIITLEHAGSAGMSS